jgi:peptidoglycan/xylan/chitin deacetylase (PgdA/CDA1 family)
VVDIGKGWVRVIDYCEKNKVKAGLGIICDSLEKDNQAYFNWIKATQKKGIIEFWCHGYDSNKDFYTTHTLEEQIAALNRCQKLAKEKLGFPLPAFGPHYSGITLDTEKAVQAVPEFKVWLYGPKNSQFYKRLSIPRVLGLEYVVTKVDFDKFKAPYEKYGFKEKVLVLQGHGNYWSPESFVAFTKIVDYLRSKHAVFMTPTEYLNYVNQGK